MLTGFRPFESATAQIICSLRITVSNTANPFVRISRQGGFSPLQLSNCLFWWTTFRSVLKSPGEKLSGVTTFCLCSTSLFKSRGLSMPSMEVSKVLDEITLLVVESKTSDCPHRRRKFSSDVLIATIFNGLKACKAIYIFWEIMNWHKMVWRYKLFPYQCNLVYQINKPYTRRANFRNPPNSPNSSSSSSSAPLSSGGMKSTFNDVWLHRSIAFKYLIYTLGKKKDFFLGNRLHITKSFRILSKKLQNSVNLQCSAFLNYFSVKQLSFN